MKIFIIAILLMAGARVHAENTNGSSKKAAADALFTNGTVLVIRIDVPGSGVASLRQDPRTYVTATLREGLASYTNVQVRLKGGAGSFRHWDSKPGLTLKMDETNHIQFHGLKKFHLNNCVQDRTCLSEWFCAELFRQAGVPAPRVAHALVELNGRRLGLYILVESVNRQFLAQYFKDPGGAVYSQSPNADITSPLEQTGGQEYNHHADLKALAVAARGTSASRLSQVLDLDRFISFMAMEVILGHWDGYSFNVKNYFVYHDLDTDKMVFMPHDMDQMLRDADLDVTPAVQGIVARAILRMPETAQRYLDRIRELSTNMFVAPALVRRIDDMVAKLVPAISSYNQQLASDFAANAGNLKTRVIRRAKGLAAQLQPRQPGVIRAAGDTLALRGWYKAREEGGSALSQVPGPSGKPSLLISTRNATTASWRLTMPLDSGTYVFEGLGCSADIRPLATDKKGDGAGLRISGSQTPRLNKLVGTSPWTKLAYEFQVTSEMKEVELICELRAASGQVWFDTESLRLRRIK